MQKQEMLEGVIVTAVFMLRLVEHVIIDFMFGFYFTVKMFHIGQSLLLMQDDGNCNSDNKHHRVFLLKSLMLCIVDFVNSVCFVLSYCQIYMDCAIWQCFVAAGDIQHS